MSFDVVKTAGLTVTDFAKIAGVSRVTASLWINGHSAPHALHASKIARLLKALTKAIKSRQLPAPGGMSRTSYVRYVKSVLSNHLKALGDS